MALKIGVMGGATGVISRDHLDKAHQLGRAIARSGCVLITGACLGLPLAAACGARQEGGLVVGISPGLSLDEHVGKYGSPTEFHDVLIFTGSGLMGREVVNIRSSDIVVIIGGRSGTLGELAIAYDEGRLIGVLTGTGGISDMVRDILATCAKNTGSQVVYDAEPERLIQELLRVYRNSHSPALVLLPGSSARRGGWPHARARAAIRSAAWRSSPGRRGRVGPEGRRYVFCSALRRASTPTLKYAPRSNNDA
jgi:uncharacterized protein (TIGR00725 family)